MKHLFVIDPIERLNPDGDSSFAFMLEAQKHGHTIYICELRELRLEDNHPYALAREISVARPTADHQQHFTVINQCHIQLDKMVDVIWMRKDPPVDTTFAHACMILDYAQYAGVNMINNPSSLRIANEKLWGMQFHQWMPPTIVSSNPSDILEFAERHHEIVIKPIDRAGGWGILQFKADDRNLKSAIEVLSNTYQEHIIAQKYLAEVRQGDKRILLADDIVVGAMWRIPADNDHRANMHVGGSVKHAALTKNDKAIIAAITPKLRTLGLRFVGIDIIGDLLTEINVTSPTGIQEMNKLSGRTDASSLAADVFKQFGLI